MARRALSPQEAADLGLPDMLAPQPARRALSAQEAAEIGLPPAPEQTSAVAAGVRGFNQGATLGWADELIGAVESIDKGFSDTTEQLAQRWGSILRGGAGGLPGEKHDPLSYEQARDAQRALEAQAREQRPEVYLPAELAGTVATSRGLGPLARGYAGAAATGAATGAGVSEAETPMGVAGGAVLGAGLGAAGEKAGRLLGAGASKVRDWVLKRAGRGIQEAGERSLAMGKTDIGKRVQSARGEAGAAASRAGNITSNIDEIVLPESVPQRTVAEARGAIEQQLQALDNAIGAAEAKAVASGIDPAAAGVGRRGEFLAKGSRFEAAQKGADKLRYLQAAREELQQRLEGLAGRAADEVLPDTAGELRAAQAALKADPRFLDLKQNLLKNALKDFPEAAADAVAKREAYRQALENQERDVAERARQLLSGEAAWEQVKQRAQRYAAPLAGSLGGGAVGTLVGIGTGQDPMDAALFGLAGAGARPALRSIARMAQHPAVASRAWTGLETLARMAPEALGPYAGPVLSAITRGPEALRALDKVLRDTDEQYARMREQQQEAAQP